VLLLRETVKPRISSSNVKDARVAVSSLDVCGVRGTMPSELPGPETAAKRKSLRRSSMLDANSYLWEEL
jgi:hypothetical protein